jgi:hypothetical protein
VQWLWASRPVLPLLTAIGAGPGIRLLLPLLPLLPCLRARRQEVATRRSYDRSRIHPCLLLMCNGRHVLLCNPSCWGLWWLQECPWWLRHLKNLLTMNCKCSYRICARLLQLLLTLGMELAFPLL